MSAALDNVQTEILHGNTAQASGRISLSTSRYELTLLQQTLVGLYAGCYVMLLHTRDYEYQVDLLTQLIRGALGHLFIYLFIFLFLFFLGGGIPG